jgi:hypothetical protein
MAEPEALGELHTAEPAPEDIPVEDEPAAPAPAGSSSRWAPSRKTARPAAVRAPKNPPPAETARGTARPVLAPVLPQPVVPVPEPEPEIDPLLLGPPLFAQQNRPLDAPRFTRTARPAEQPPQPAAATRQDSPAPDPSRAGGWPAPSGPAPQNLADHPGVPDHPGEPGHPGVLDHPGEPRQLAPAAPPAGPPAGRPALEPPQMGQLNRGLPAGTEHPATGPVRQATTVQQPRPPLEAPQLGQLNRPLEPAGPQPVGDEPTGSGLPGRPAKVADVPLTAGPARAEDQPEPWAVGQDETEATPSGLLAPPPARIESPAAEQPAEEEVPSGLPRRAELP